MNSLIQSLPLTAVHPSDVCPTWRPISAHPFGPSYGRRSTADVGARHRLAAYIKAQVYQQMPAADPKTTNKEVSKWEVVITNAEIIASCAWRRRLNAWVKTTVEKCLHACRTRQQRDATGPTHCLCIAPVESFTKPVLLTASHRVKSQQPLLQVVWIFTGARGDRVVHEGLRRDRAAQRVECAPKVLLFR